MQFTDPNNDQPHWCHPDGRVFCASSEEDDEQPAASAQSAVTSADAASRAGKLPVDAARLAGEVACVLYFGTFPEPFFLPTYSSSMAASAPVASATPHAARQPAGVTEQKAASATTARLQIGMSTSFTRSRLHQQDRNWLAFGAHCDFHGTSSFFSHGARRTGLPRSVLRR